MWQTRRVQCCTKSYSHIKCAFAWFSAWFKLSNESVHAWRHECHSNRPHKCFLFLLRGSSACVMCRKQMVRILLAAIRAYVRQVGAKRWTYWMRCKVQLWLLGVKGQMHDGCDTRYFLWPDNCISWIAGFADMKGKHVESRNGFVWK